MFLVAYITKYQAVDKVIPLLIQAQECDKDITCLVLLRMEEKCLDSSYKELIALFVEQGGAVLDLRAMAFSRGGEESLNRSLGGKYTLWKAIENIADNRLLRHFFSGVASYIELKCANVVVKVVCSEMDQLSKRGDSKMVLVLPGYDSKGEFNKSLARIFQERNFVRAGYFKSLTDRGKGMSAVAALSGRLKEIQRDKKNKISRESIDVILGPTSDHFAKVQAMGFFQDIPFIETGHSSKQPAWRSLIKQKYAENKSSDTIRIAIFSRGEKWGGKKVEQDFCDSSDVQEIIDDIRFIMKNKFKARNYKIYIKPHPYQDIRILQEMNRESSDLEITYIAPALLALRIDVAIGMFTNAIVDCLVNGIPCLDRIYDRKEFWSVHPDGSSFSSLGAIECKSSEDVRSNLAYVVGSVLLSKGDNISSRQTKKDSRDSCGWFSELVATCKI